MADIKISALPAATTIAAASDVAPLVSGGVTTKATPFQMVQAALDFAPVTVDQGGTGVTTLTGLAYGNGTAAMTAATAAQIVSAIGATAVQNATTAENVSGTVAIANGGTGQTTRQAAINALAGGTTAAQFLRGDGTNITLAAIQASDIPTLNQNTTGTAANVTGVVAIANGGTGQTTANAALNALLPTQTGNAGKVLGTDGTNATWVTGGGGSSLSGVTQATTPFLTALGAGASTTATGLNNTFVGRDAGKVVTSGVNNTFIGAQAGDSVTTGNYNTVIGDQAAASLVGGSNNTVVGSQAMTTSTAGTGNTVIGREAGKNLTGDYNVVIGFQAGDIATTMGNSVLIGAYAGAVTTAGSNNMVGVGYAALNNLTTGARNTAVGNYAGANNQTSADNACFGDSAGRQATGANNTLLGSQAGVAVTTGGSNTFVGKGAGSVVTTGANNTVVGLYVGTAAMTGQVILADGSGNRRIQFNENGALSFNGTDFGTAGQILQSNGAGAVPTWVTGGGGSSLIGLTQNATPFNTALGFETISASATGTENVAVGYQCGTSITSGTDNVAMGSQSLYSTTTGSNNVAIGNYALYSSVSTSNNVALGANVLGQLTTGSSNIVMGTNAGVGLTNGSSNMFLGQSAGSSLTSANAVTIIGAYNGSGLPATPDGYTVLCAGTTGSKLGVVLNNNKAASFGAIDAFGSAGQVLQSNGDTTAPTWTWRNVAKTASVSTSTSIAANQEVVFVDASGGGSTQTLPTAVGNTGVQITLKRVDSTQANTVTVGSAGGNVDGAATQTLDAGHSLTFTSDGTDWWITGSFAKV